MEDEQELYVEELARGVQEAFASFRIGEIELGLGILEKLEFEILDAFLAPTIGNKFENRRALLWLLSVRALIFVDLGRLQEATKVLESVRASAAEHEESCAGQVDTCFCDELVLASLHLSSVQSQQGRFDLAIQTLVKIKDVVPDQSHFEYQEYNHQIATWLEEFGDALGYNDLTARVDYSISSIGSLSLPLSATRSAHWRPPIQIEGPIFEKFESDYALITNELSEIGNSDLGKQLELQRRKIELLNVWLADAPFSTNARCDRLITIYSVLELLLQLNQIDDLLILLSTFDSEIEFLFEWTLEKTGFHRDVERFIYRFAVMLMRHTYDDDATKDKMFRLAGQYLSAGLDLFDESRQVTPVTQATGLVTSLLSNVLDVSYRMLSRDDLALHQRNRRDIILSEILRRDPLNDQARELIERHRNIDDMLDPGMVTEITDWNWFVTPIFD
jgi:hypothetical protein